MRNAIIATALVAIAAMSVGCSSEKTVVRKESVTTVPATTVERTTTIQSAPVTTERRTTTESLEIE
jgi:hypothetical protein